jgi:hypothetical protein
MENPKQPVDPEFEAAVSSFAHSLDPEAEVFFDHTVAGRASGEPLRCDGWIDANFCNRWPLSILASYHQGGGEVSAEDITTFLAEIRAAGANTGVMYSRTGFTPSALQTGQQNGIVCCRIGQNGPAELPEALYLEQFACLPQVRLTLLELSSNLMVFTWGDVFELDHERGKILDHVSNVIAESEASAVEMMKLTASFPEDWEMEIHFAFTDSLEYLKMRTNGYWKKYKARLAATLQNGSYCVDNATLQATQSGPGIDSHSARSGEAWTEIKDEDPALPARISITVLNHGKWQDQLQAQLGPQSPFDEASPDMRGRSQSAG